jgi:hypothetical protein
MLVLFYAELFVECRDEESECSKICIESCWNITDGWGARKIFRQGMDERTMKVSFTVSSEICLFHTACVMTLGLSKVRLE